MHCRMHSGKGAISFIDPRSGSVNEFAHLNSLVLPRFLLHLVMFARVFLRFTQLFYSLVNVVHGRNAMAAPVAASMLQFSICSL